MARDDRRRRDDPPGRRRPHRPRPPARTLKEYADRPLRIGSFSAASNVTGIVSNTVAIAEILHEHDALSFWDFAAAAPYIDIEMYPDPEHHPLAHKDAIFLSPHKFIGGPSTPGVLVARRELFANRVPDVPGGGTVAYVNDADHAYLPEPEHREEGGTPAIIESVRAGLVFQLKQAVGVETIRAAEERFLSPGGGVVERGAVDRDPRQPRRRPALDRVVRRTRSVGSLPAPQLRGRRAQRPVRDPVARRLLVRRALRPPAARHRHRAQPRVRARDHRWLRGHQARLGARELQLLPLRRGRRLHRRGGQAGRARRLAAAGRLPLRHRRPASGRTARAWSSRRCASTAITYDEQGMHAPTSQLAGDESLLAQHLADGEKLLGRRPASRTSLPRPR